MDTLLILLGVVGFAAVIIAIHVFSVESEAYGYRPGEHGGDVAGDAGLSEREARDRRNGLHVVFPLLINGTLVQEDRRHLGDRRQAA